MKYDTVDYWNERVNPNGKGSSPAFIISYISSQIVGCKRVLDFGPGVGRIFPVYKGTVQELYGYDISDQYAQRAKIAATENMLDFNLIVEKEIKQLPFRDKMFDAAVAVQVFIHQKPQYIVNRMSELARVAKKVVTYHGRLQENTNNKNTSHCFCHNYEKICRENNWEVLSLQKTEKYICLVYKDKYR